MKKASIAIHLLLTAALLTGTVLYLTVGGRTVHYSTSGVFALMGIINLCFALKFGTPNRKFFCAMSLGLVLCMLGDILLGKDFVIGAATFASGHICYFAAYCFAQKPRRADFITGGVIFAAAALFLLLCPWLSFSQAYMQWVCLVYALIISMMVGKALSNFLADMTAANALLAIGSCLFFFSDLMLVFNWFMDTGKITGKLCMGTYFPAQWFLATAMLVLIHRSERKRLE